MIVQTAADGAKRFVITMEEHMSLATQFAAHFGNDTFAGLDPRDEMMDVVAHHDAGWHDFDTKAPADPGTGYPYNLSETPFELTGQTSRLSPDFNEARHAFCGLLSSMHSWGLYHGRYGISDIVLLDKLKDQNRDAAKELLDGELARQERLKETLRANPETASWVEEGQLMRCYKQLQFFDTLALYFNRTHEGARDEGVFPCVPTADGGEVTVTVTPLGDGTYRVAPFPFDTNPLEVSFAGRYLTPQANADGSLADVLSRIAPERQSYTLVSA